MPKDEKPNFEPISEKKVSKDLETKKYVVRHMDMEPENQDFPIRVDTTEPKTGGMLEFHPGDVVDLTRTQVEILKNAVIESSFSIGDIGDYPSEAANAENPAAAAQKMYPGFTITTDKRTGKMTATKKTPRFSVERFVEENDGWAA